LKGALSVADEGDKAELDALTEFLYVVPVGLMNFRMDGTIMLANPLISQLLMPFVPASDLADAYCALAPLMPDLSRRGHEFGEPLGVIVDHERCAITAQGRPVVFSVTVHRLHGGLNTAVIEDVTRSAEQERQLFEDRQRFRAIFDNVRDYAIYTTGACGRIDEWNQSLLRFGGWHEQDLIGQSLDVFFPREMQPAETLLARARETGSVETEGWVLRQDGTRAWTNTVLTVLPDPAGQVRGFVGVSRDMTERKRSEDELRRLATTDPLTGAFNRKYGQECLAAAFPRLSNSGRVPAVIMLDIDHFKSINDRYGHDTGDLALCATVDSVAATLCSEGSMVRWGGEELLVILQDSTAQSAIDLAERLRVAISEAYVTGPTGEVRMTVSIGVAQDDGQGPNDVVRRADAALYEAKRGGRDRVVFGPAKRIGDRNLG
jgi:diguanylate cyclase (GGDEF)-like protein/PAS domain S-box-containing protein